jgi:ferric-dicitrate binding protein FerR (iron transport regulator)
MKPDMIPEIDIWRAATWLIRQHGEDAEIVAAQRHAEMLINDDDEGRQVWSRIRRAAAELQAMPTMPNEAIYCRGHFSPSSAMI